VGFGLVALTAFLLVFGSIVRVYGVGLACPDWPLCFGEVVPAYEFKVYLEFGHRVVAGFVSLGFVGLAWHLRRTGALAASPILRVLFPLAALVLLVQVILGGLTVLELLAEWTVASHLTAGNTFCSLLLLIALSLRQMHMPRGRTAIAGWKRGLAALFIVLVPAQIILGGLVSGSHAGLVCATWPSCNGAAWFPSFSGLIGLQLMHRITAYTLLAAAACNVWAQWSQDATRRPALALFVLVCLQATLGIANVFLRLPMEVTLLHSAGAAAILLNTAWLNFEAWVSPLDETLDVMTLVTASEAS
jgi:cytochrome c oxidase assembly protein subunit 15